MAKFGDGVGGGRCVWPDALSVPLRFHIRVCLCEADGDVVLCVCLCERDGAVMYFSV